MTLIHISLSSEKDEKEEVTETRIEKVFRTYFQYSLRLNNF